MSDDWLSNNVLRACADDYESLETIVPEVQDWAREKRKALPTRDEILRRIQQLIDEGLAQSYFLSSQHGIAERVSYSAEQASTLWFYATPEGRERVREALQRD